MPHIRCDDLTLAALDRIAPSYLNGSARGPARLAWAVSELEKRILADEAARGAGENPPAPTEHRPAPPPPPPNVPCRPALRDRNAPDGD